MKMNSNYERFIDAFNEIDKHMREELGVGRELGFVEVLNRFIERRPKLKGLKQLKVYANLRNVAVHTREFKNPLFDPSDAAVKGLEEIRGRLIKSVTAGDRFKRLVKTVTPEDSLIDVLGHVFSNDFSQFPVYTDSKFEGLLTENGLTRWLAAHVRAEDSLIELREHRVEDVMAMEEHKTAAKLVGSSVPVDVVEAMFADDPTLEAVIVTNSGKPHEKPIGIATTWDIARE